MKIKKLRTKYKLWAILHPGILTPGFCENYCGSYKKCRELRKPNIPRDESGLCIQWLNDEELK